MPQREKKRKAQEQAEKTGISPARQHGTGKGNIKSSFYFSEYNWGRGKFPKIPKEDMVIYKLHVRGFSMGMRNSNSKRGTVGAIEHRLDDLKKLGVTTLLLMQLTLRHRSITGVIPQGTTLRLRHLI